VLDVPSDPRGKEGPQPTNSREASTAPAPLALRAIPAEDMMQPVPWETLRTIEPDFEDARGVIRNVIAGPMNHLAFITSKAGSVRGGHYHLRGWQWCWILEGKVRCFSRLAKDPDSEVRIVSAHPYDLIITPPGVAHRHEYLEDTKFFAIYDVPRLKLEKQDTFRFENWK